MDSKLTALVTGANRGIGAGVAQQLAERGYEVIIGSRNLAAGITTADRIAAECSAEVTAVQLDVTDQQSVDQAATFVTARWGRLDVLVNNAGAYYDDWQSAAGADLSVVQNAIDVNLVGSWRTTLAMLPLIRNGKRRRIVNVSSHGASITTIQPDHPGYRVSKTALNALTKMLATELKADGILVNAVCPGWTATEMGEWKGHSVEVGAANVLYAVDFEDDGPNGGFFTDGNPLPW